jgi:hypothetical protein
LAFTLPSSTIVLLSLSLSLSLASSLFWLSISTLRSGNQSQSYYFFLCPWCRDFRSILKNFLLFSYINYQPREWNQICDNLEQMKLLQ